ERHNYRQAPRPVDSRPPQPCGRLHGGASVVRAESVGRIAANLCVAPDRQACVGLDINANHLRTVRSGWVYAHAHPIHLGQSTQVWQIDLTNEDGQAVCASRLTMAVINKAQPVYS
ncbi:MAG: hotdog fold thioesterase, partial [Sphingobacteriia bacterium]